MGDRSSTTFDERSVVAVVLALEVVVGGGYVNSRYSCGLASISVVQAHITPSVEQEMIMFAPCVPTQFTE
jgi:hypothetical protein